MAHTAYASRKTPVTLVLMLFPVLALADTTIPVTVKNTTSSPVPVTVTGGSVTATVPSNVNATVTGTVGISGTPSVNANITNPSLTVQGNVGVTALPAITGNVNATISGTPNVAVTSGSVMVNNTASNPIPVSGNFTAAVQDPGKTAIALESNLAMLAGAALQDFGLSPTIPTGTRYVLETESFYCHVQAGYTPLIQVSYTLNNSLFYQYFPVQKIGSDGSQDYFVGSFSNKIYVDPYINLAYALVIELGILPGPNPTSFPLQCNFVTFAGYSIQYP